MTNMISESMLQACAGDVAQECREMWGKLEDHDWAVIAIAAENVMRRLLTRQGVAIIDG